MKRLTASLLLAGLCSHTALAQPTSSAAEHLSAAIQLATVSHQDQAQIDFAPFKDFLTFVETSYPLVHQKLQREVIADYSLLYTWPGTDAQLQPVLFDSHYDVVPIEPGTADDWTHPPFDGVIADGYLWGRGAIDDKATVISTLEAMETLLADGFEPARTLIFSFGHDEEIGGRNGAANIAAHLEGKNVKLAYMVAEGGIVVENNPMLPEKPMAMVNLAEKTYATLTLVARGQGGHSSMPVEDNAIVKLSRALATLQDNPFEPELIEPVSSMLRTVGEEVGGLQGWLLSNQWLSEPLLLSQLTKDRMSQGMVRSTTGITMFNAGVKENVIPQVAEAKVNFRLLPGVSVETLVARVGELIDDPSIRIESESWKTSPPVADMEGEGYSMIRSSINTALPEALVTPSLLMATTDTPHYQHLTRNIYRFHPVVVRLEQSAGVHGTDERIALESIDKAVALSSALIQGAGGA
ncbi:M20/M25/M40 family metallo-hydrolase [Parahaliea maris]|uniref:M20/M25/M40 family metallo-hydrolase n=1 Tax=Parahaliea maris TaxID=2716870 RepID=A0A5C9A1Y5_9GAMM|nr:M20/M25/M40 family metallo-hydrolase [Parahaliea maris]TXS94014.1 M20/M25/M40 family metallo-hydrolase [Parahaliea maris]